MEHALRVGVDARATEAGFKSHFGRGIGRYAGELLRLLPERAALRSEGSQSKLQVEFLLGDQLRGSTVERKIIQMIPVGRETVESQLCLPWRLRRSGVHLCHFLAHGDAPAWGNFPTIVTVHDLIPLKFPELYRAPREDWRYRLARSLELGAIQRARGILTVSEATKRDVVDILGVSPEKILVTYNGADPRFRSPERSFVEREAEKRRLREEFGLPLDVPLALYVGGIDPRKNVPFLLEVFAAVVKQVNAKLVIVGRHDGDKFLPRIEERIQTLRLEPSLIRKGFFPDERLPDLYRAADVFPFPSLYEGFGLPALEAALTGVPVIAGRNSAMPEVLGTSYRGLLPDLDHEAWVELLVSLLRNPESCFGLAAQALAHVRGRFTWEETADRTIEGYLTFGRGLPNA